jgi:para-aminobenzoate synthetase
VLLVDNHDSYTWNLHQLLWSSTGCEPEVVDHADPVLAGGEGGLVARGFTHVVVGPGPGSPHRPTDVGATLGLFAADRLPVLGVCLGHQALVVAAGGRVGRAPRPVHGVTSRVRHGGTGLFADVPDGFLAVRYHSLAVVEPLPDGLDVLARADDDGVVMAIGHRERAVVGVQFHPESVSTDHGATIVRNFLRMGSDRRRAAA